MLFRCGTLNCGGEFVDAVKENCDAMGLQYELLNAQELWKLYPGFKFQKDGDVALLDPLGGFLDSDLILQTHVELTRVRKQVFLRFCFCSENEWSDFRR